MKLSHTTLFLGSFVLGAALFAAPEASAKFRVIPSYVCSGLGSTAGYCGITHGSEFTMSTVNRIEVDFYSYYSQTVGAMACRKSWGSETNSCGGFYGASGAGALQVYLPTTEFNQGSTYDYRYIYWSVGNGSYEPLRGVYIANAD